MLISSFPVPMIWTPQHHPAPLRAGEVHLWLVNLDEVDAPGWETVLSPEERSRAERFRNPLHGCRFTTGRGVLRSLLGRYLNYPGEAIQLGYGDRGKPWVEFPPSSLQFNLAHSHHLALYGFTLHHAIGVDLEQIRAIANLPALTSRFFSSQEHRTLMALPPENQSLSFFRYWTVKESYLKATGEGIARLKQINVQLGANSVDGSISLEDQNQPLTGWTLQEINPAPGYVAAWATRGQSLPAIGYRYIQPR